MRLPFPDHIPFVPAFFFAALLCAIQQFQGTNPTFSLCCFFYIIVATTAFNIAGGFSRTSGGFIFFNAMLSVILALCVKAYLGEPADSNLVMPLLSIGVLLAGMCMMTVAVYLSRRVTPKRSLLGRMITDSNMQTATVGCMLAGVFMMFAGYFIPTGSGTVFSALNQMNRFFPLAIILGVINAIRRSGGTRSVNLPVLLSGGAVLFVGLISFSKEGMFSAFACWILAASSQRYKVSRIQIFGIILGVIFLVRYLVPYSQYGRVYKQDTISGNVGVAVDFLSNLGELREEYIESSSDAYEERIYGYYDKSEGLFDRLQMMSIDDALIAHTHQFGTFGLMPIAFAFENVVPHFIWKDKPVILTGNIYAHEIGLLSEADDSTGVSFSSTSSAFHLAGWPGIFLLAPAVWFGLFFILDTLCGDTRKSPWGLLVLVLYAHAGAEADISTVIYMYFFTSLGIIFIAVVGSYLMPVFGTLLIGPEGIMLRRGVAIRSIANRLHPPVSSQT
jgi:hypothetical protein